MENPNKKGFLTKYLTNRFSSQATDFVISPLIRKSEIAY